MLLSKNSQVLLAIAWEAYSLLNPTVSSAAVGCDPPSPAPVLPTHKGVYNKEACPTRSFALFVIKRKKPHNISLWVVFSPYNISSMHLPALAPSTSDTKFSR